MSLKIKEKWTKTFNQSFAFRKKFRTLHVGNLPLDFGFGKTHKNNQKQNDPGCERLRVHNYLKQEWRIMC